MNTFRNIKKNAKALSPVVASIILIAVTVAVSVVVAAWMGGMSMGLMGNAEQVSVTNVAFDPDQTTNPGDLTVTLQNTGSATVTLSSATIDGQAYTIGNGATSGDKTLPKGTADSFLLSPTAATGLGATGFTDTAAYQIKIMTAKGTTIIYTASYTAP